MGEEPQGRIVELRATGGITVGTTASLSITTSMSPVYLRSAALFARHAHELELTGLAALISEREFDHEPYRAFAASSVAFAAFFVEAALYEFLSITVRQPHAFDAPLSKQEVRAIEQEWRQSRSSRRIKVLDRYNQVLTLGGKDALDKNASPVTDVRTLIDFRNALFHYAPEWEHDRGSTRKVVGGLRSKVKATNPFHGSSAEFPNRYLSHGCAEWAVGSVIDFYNLFCQTIGLKQRYERTDASFATRVEKSPPQSRT